MPAAGNPFSANTLTGKDIGTATSTMGEKK